MQKDHHFGERVKIHILFLIYKYKCEFSSYFSSSTFAATRIWSTPHGSKYHMTMKRHTFITVSR